MTTSRRGAAATLVTGAAGGIGSAIARRRLHRGERLLLIDHDRDALLKLRQEFASAPVEILVADVASPRIAEEVDAFLERDALFTGSLFLGVVHAAGIGGWVPFDQIDIAHWDGVMNTNVRGAVLVTRAMLPRMCEGSTIVVLASDSARHAFPRRTAYCASKAGLCAAFDVLREEVRDVGIRVSNLLFNRVDTRFNDGMAGSRPEALQPEDVAAVVDMLLSLRPGAEVREVLLAGQRSPFGS